MALRHLTSINDLTNDEIEIIFSLAETYLQELGDPALPFRIGNGTDACAGSIMATLFYEPSTRSRLSFESAMSRLGGKVISSADPDTSSAAKGETLADTARIVSAYADVIVLRHPREGAAKLAAQHASVPVINGGDGAHEHPTQTLCDLFTIRREKGDLKNLKVALFGDLKGSRTIHSLAYALARFGANILLMPADGMELPEHVEWRLRHEFGYVPLDAARRPLGVTSAYGPADRSVATLSDAIGVLYLTRFQKERWRGATGEYPAVDAEFMSAPQFEHTLVLHPLPRVNELDPEFDSDPRAGYFRQASYGVPVRMALISMLLGGIEPLLARFESGFRERFGDASVSEEAVCQNANCISRAEGKPRFHLPTTVSARRRCVYCDHDLA